MRMATTHTDFKQIVHAEYPTLGDVAAALCRRTLGGA